MGASTDSSSGDTVFFGRGEFQIKDVYVCAEVKVLCGIISAVNFSSPKGEALEDADDMAKRLIGQPLSRALEVNAREIDPFIPVGGMDDERRRKYKTRVNSHKRANTPVVDFHNPPPALPA